METEPRSKTSATKADDDTTDPPVDLVPETTIDEASVVALLESYHNFQFVAIVFPCSYVMNVISLWWLFRSGRASDRAVYLTAFLLFCPIHLLVLMFVRKTIIIWADIVRKSSLSSSGKEHARWDCVCGERIYDEYTQLRGDGICRLQTASDDLLFKDLLLELDDSILGSFYQKILRYAIPERDHVSQAGPKNGKRRTDGWKSLSRGPAAPKQEHPTQAAPKASQRRTGFWDLRRNAMNFMLQCRQHGSRSLPFHYNATHRVGARGDTQVTRPHADAERQYLLLCIPMQGSTNQLLQIETTRPPTSDRAFFQLLRQTYKAHRGQFRLCFSLRRLIEIRFVQFELFRHDLADVRKYDCIPPETQRDTYVYRPMPAEFEPPIGKNQMKHLYDHPDHADNIPVCFARVPRKLHERLFYKSLADRNEGWGVCFIEGVSWSRGCLFGLVGVMASTMFGVAWTVLKDDIQGGFGVASYMLAVLVLGLGALQGAFEM